MKDIISAKNVGISTMHEEKEKKTYGIYSVEESFREDGLWQGYICSVVSSEGQKQGKLYPKTDGRHFYQEKPKDNELEI